MVKQTLVIGGTGSWGHELVSHLLNTTDCHITVYTRGEHKQVEMRRTFWAFQERLSFVIGDIRDLKRLSYAAHGMDEIFHLAALKHVPVCEENPWEAVQTNVNGTNNVIIAALENKVRKVVLISTDKAVDPLNLYGTTKSVAEKLFIAANNNSVGTSFVVIRAGNVLGTNGSVVPLFIEQLKQTNTLTITLEEMTRFFLRVEDAIQLVFKALNEAVGGEIFVVKMPSTTVIDLAQVMIRHLGNSQTTMKNIGIRPGEKIHEVLVSRYEATRTIVRDDYYIILPMINLKTLSGVYDLETSNTLDQEYNSDNAEKLTHKGIEILLSLGGFLESDYDTNIARLGPDELLDFFRREGWVN